MKISVITAAWNSSKTIQDTLRSVLNQRYTNVEHIIKDGGSTDDTVAICEDYKRKFYSSEDTPQTPVKTMKIISDSDKGIYDAMNQGIEAASGDVIGILNSDDFYTTDDVLERVAREFEADPELEALYGDIHFVDDADLQSVLDITLRRTSDHGCLDSALCLLTLVFMSVRRFTRSMDCMICSSGLRPTSK